MQKDLVIFPNQTQNYKTQSNIDTPNLILSDKQYQKSIKDAYHRGAKYVYEKYMKHRQIKNEVESASERERAEVKERFINITTRHDIELLRVKSLFPFEFFPDTMIIDTTKLTIAHRQFFATEYVTTIPLKDISDATLQTAFFMGSLLIKYMPQSNSPGMNQPVDVSITSLKRKDAIRAKNILKGVMVAKAENIDISKLSPEEVVTVIEKFGHSEGIL